MEGIRYSRYKKFVTPIIRSKKTQAYGIIILSLLTASFFLVFAIRPTVKTIAQLRKEIKDNRLVEEKFREKINTLTRLSQTYNEVAGDLEIVEKVLPSKPNFENLLTVLETTAFQNQVEIFSFQFRPITLFQPKKEKMKFQLTPISFKVVFRGDYQNLLSQLHALSQSGRLIRIEKFQMKKSREKEEKLNLEIEGKSFYVN